MYVAIGSAIIGAGASIYGANKAADAQTSAANSAAMSQAASAADQQRIYEEQQRFITPYQEAGLNYLPLLQSAISGKPVEYTDPGYKLLNAEDVSRLNVNKVLEQHPGLTAMDAIKGLNYFPSLITYDPNKQWYKGPDGQITSERPNRTANFSMQDNPAYQWQKSETDKNMNRQLSARGRSNSTYGMNSLANAYGNLAAQEYEKQYNRLLDPIKIAQGYAGQAGANNAGLANVYANNANAQSAIALNKGQVQGSLYAGYGGLVNNALNTGLNAYSYMNNNPYGGNNGSYQGLAEVPQTSDYLNNYEFKPVYGGVMS